MKRLFCLPLVVSLNAAAARADWFTVTGDPQDAAADTVEVDPTSIMATGHLKLLKLRVNRQTPRTNPRGVKFRSFEAIVEVDCESRTGRYVRTNFFDGPLWTRPSGQVDYGASSDSVLAFRSIEPNPTQRLIRAVCTER